MRQQVLLSIDLTYDVDATLTRGQIINRVLIDLGRLENTGPFQPSVDYRGATITNLLEEAEIYKP